MQKDAVTSKSLLHIFSRLPLRSSGKPAERLVIQCDQLEAVEYAKLYITSGGSRIRKDQLLKLRKTYERTMADYEIYCLPGDKAAAIETLNRRIASDVKALLAYAVSVDAAVQRGYDVVSQSEWVERLLAGECP